MRGLHKMRKEKRPVYEVYYLLLAIEGGAKKLLKKDFGKLMRDELWDDICTLNAVENLSEEDAASLACIRKEMKEYDLKEVAKALKRLEQVKGRYGLLD